MLSIKIFLSCPGRAINTRGLRSEYQKDDCISHSIGFDNWQITQSFFLIIDRSRKHIPSVSCRRFVMLRITLFSRFWNPGCASVDFPAKPGIIELPQIVPPVSFVSRIMKYMSIQKTVNACYYISAVISSIFERLLQVLIEPL